jgi:PKD repeat protein
MKFMKQYFLLIAIFSASFSFSQFSFTTDASSQCAPANVTFTNTSTAGVHFDWDMGDGTSYSDMTNLVHGYSNGGNYWVTMWVYDASMLYIGQTSQEVILSGAPAGFNINGTSLCPGDELTMNIYMPTATNFSWNFDDGQVESGSNYVSHTYGSPGEYHPTVTFDIPGCGTYSLTDTVTITNSSLFFSSSSTYMNVDANSACPGDELYGWTQNGYSSYSWDFDDGNFDSGTNVQWTYSLNGTYDVNLTVTNGCGVDTVMTETILVSNSTPVQNASLYLPDTLCPGEEFNADAYGNNIASYLWNMDDGSPAQTDSYFNYSYSTAGTYDVEVTFTNTCGNTTVLTHEIVVTSNSPISNPDLYISSTTVCPGDIVNFQSNYEYNYYISYGDGNGSNSSNDYSYDSPGVYPITATIQNICGNSVTLFDTVTVVDNLPISGSVGFYTNGNPSCPNIEVEFDGDWGFQGYSWNFGDGSTGSGQEIDHVFNGTGVYAVELTVQNGCGATASATQNIIIQNNVPIDYIDWSISTDTICPGDNVFFQADNDDGLTYNWNLGDGTISSQFGIEHSYDAVGVYPIVFTATNGCGIDSTINDTIVVSDNYTPSAGDIQAYVQEEGCIGDEMIFVIIPAGTGTISWDFGDGNSTTDVEQIFVQGIANVDVAYHTYTAQGTYWAQFSITNACGNTYTDSIEITIGGPGDLINTDASFFWDETQTACQGQAVEFMAIGGATYIWDFGDGSGQLVTYSSLDPVAHTYQDAGTYTINLTSINGCGQTENSDENIFVPDSKIDVTTNTVTDPNCGMNNGLAIVSASGGTGPYEYSWTNGDEGVIADSLASGIYVVTVTDLNECSNEGIATVSDEEGVTILIDNVVDVDCYGENNGSISVSLLGGQPPYEILWSNGDQTEDIFGLQAGPYEIFVTDANGCFAVQSIEVTQPSKSNISIITSLADCNASDGGATATINNGTPPYNFIWPNATGASNQTGGLSPGIYSLLVIDGNTCLLEKDFAINEFGGPIIITDSLFTGSCNGDLSDIYLSTIGGQAPFNYSWSNGDSNEDLIDVFPGEYSVEISSSNGCSSYQFFKVEQSLPSQTDICMVDVDSLTNTNLVVWVPLSDPGIASYNIYKESSEAGLYYWIGNSSADSISQYFDYLSDPSIRSWRYKVAAVDDCANEAELSEEHKTIHLTSNQGINGEVNLIWDHYNGFSYATYYINRYHPTTGWEVIDSVASNLTSYTDDNLPGDSSLVYMISIVTPSACTAFKATDYNSSRSNKQGVNMPDPDEDDSGFDELNNELTVFPNPTSALVKMIYTQNIKSVEIFDIGGKLVYESHTVNSSQIEIDLSHYQDGIYNFRLTTDEKTINGKVIKN